MRSSRAAFATATLAQDLTAEVFHQALVNLGRFEWRGLPFVAWPYRKSQRTGAPPRKTTSQFLEFCHLILRSTGDKRRQSGFVFFANRFEMIELGVTRHQRREIAFAVHPERLVTSASIVESRDVFPLITNDCGVRSTADFSVA